MPAPRNPIFALTVAGEAYCCLGSGPQADMLVPALITAHIAATSEPGDALDCCNKRAGGADAARCWTRYPAIVCGEGEIP